MPRSSHCGMTRNQSLSEIETWLTSELKTRYPQTDEWVIEGVSSAALSSEDKRSALDTIANFLGNHAELDVLVDELFRRRGIQVGNEDDKGCDVSRAAPQLSRNGNRIESLGSRGSVDKLVPGARTRKALSGEGSTNASLQAKPGDSEVSFAAPSGTTAAVVNRSTIPLQPKDLNRHVVNCLVCGKIFDCRPKDGVLTETAKAFLEKAGECTFCGEVVVLELRGDGLDKNRKGKMPLPSAAVEKVRSSGAHDVSSSADGGKVAGARVNTAASTVPVSGMRAKMTSHYEKDCGMSSEDAASKAKDAKDRLVEFDRTAASRTVVIDDQSDWFEIDGNAWLGEAERVELKKQAAEMMEAEEERRRRSRMTFTLDLLGRRVGCSPSESDSCASDITGSEAIVVEGSYGSADKPALVRGVATPTSDIHSLGSGSSSAPQNAQELELHRITTNPSIKTSPLFLTGTLASKSVFKVKTNTSTRLGDVRSGGVGSGQLPGTNGTGSSTSAEANVREQTALKAATQRIQSCRRRVLDESPFESVAKEDATMMTHAVAMASTQVTGPLDICPPTHEGAETPFALIRPPPRRQISPQHSNKHEILLPGLIVIRDYLPMELQKEIVSTIRNLGVGPGGFYTPSYRDGAELNLAMMCMGLHWEPRLGTYQSARTEHDGAIPPQIPPALRRLAHQALVDVERVIEKNKAKPLPPANFDICLVNHYKPGSGRLGMHQDKSESRDSLRRGVPVVSLSIGDAADFHFSRSSTDFEASSKVRLESGDLLVFGGASRMVFHGVSMVHPSSGPNELRSAPVNLLPGRINLTFRES